MNRRVSDAFQLGTGACKLTPDILVLAALRAHFLRVGAVLAQAVICRGDFVLVAFVTLSCLCERLVLQVGEKQLTACAWASRQQFAIRLKRSAAVFCRTLRYFLRHSMMSWQRLHTPTFGIDAIFLVFLLFLLCLKAKLFWWAGARE